MRKLEIITAQKMKFSIKEMRIWSHLLKKSLMENFIFCAVYLLLELNLGKGQSPNFSSTIMQI